MRITRMLLTLLLVMIFLTGCGQEAAVQKKPLTDMEKFMVKTGLNDIQWVSVYWPGKRNENGILISGSENQVFSREENKQLVSEIVKAISLGTYQEKSIDLPLIPPIGQYDITIRLSNGKKINAFYDGKQIIFPVPRLGLDGISGDKGIVINPGKDFAGIINNIKSGKTKINQKVRTLPEIRNQQMVINPKEQAIFFTYTEDPAFNNFDETKIDNYKKYGEEFIKAAQKKGIKPEKVRKAFSLLDQDIYKVKIPVILETGKYEGKNAMVLVYKWEGVEMIREIDGKKPKSEHIKNPRLGHIIIYVIDMETNKIMKKVSCG